MCTVCYLLFIACSLLMTNASILNDLQEAQKFVEQLDYDYSAVAADAAAQQRSAADLLWYDYGGGSGGSSSSVGSGVVNYYGGGGSPLQAPGAAATMLIGAEKRGDATPSSNNVWFGPRLGRRKRRGGSTFNGGFVQPVDGNVDGPAVPQEAMSMAVTTAAGQAVVSDLINNAPWVLVPIVENSLYNQLQYKQNSRSGRSSSEDVDEVSSRHMARSPPFSPPFSPRLGRQVSMARPQVPRLGREALQFRRDARSPSYQQNAATALLRQQQQQIAPAGAGSAQATAAARRHAVQ